MATVETLITAEEFGLMPDDGRRTELVRGRIVVLPPPQLRHGRVCSRIFRIVGNFAEDHGFGQVLMNDTGVVTQRDPATVRGADAAYYGLNKLPNSLLPNSYPTAPPDLIFEVKSPSDRWPDILEKVQEYLAIGVLAVCVLDPETRKAHLYPLNQAPRVLDPDDELAFPESLGDFRVVVRRFFE